MIFWTVVCLVAALANIVAQQTVSASVYIAAVFVILALHKES